MRMATHGCFSVRRCPMSAPSTPRFTFLLTLLVLISTHLVAFGAADTNEDSLLKFKTSLENSESLGSWSAGKAPCSGNHTNWKGVLCHEGDVYALHLEKMGLSGQIDLDSLVPLSSLRILSFKNNNFHGSMPDWKKLPALKALYLSSNHFSGDIPQDIFQGMSRLKKVDLAYNEFTGKIPSSLSSPSLKDLRLENNKFSGAIPYFRKGLTSLNLSNNQLEGPIPQSLENFQADSFSGNKGLCGKPMGTDCSNSRGKLSVVYIVAIVVCVLLLMGLVVVFILGYLRSLSQERYDSIIRPIHHQHQNSRGQDDDDDLEADFPLEFKKIEPTPKVDQNQHKLSFVQPDRDNFDLQDLLKASAEVLGSGKFGSSFKATLDDGEAVVVKRFNHMNNVDKEEFLEHMRRVGRLHHPNVLPIVAYYYRKEEKLLVVDHLHNGSLAARLHGNPSAEKRSLDWPTRLRIVKGVARGLLYLQKELPSIVVAHGHLKSTNVVLDDDLNPLLMDYALTPVINIEQVHQLLVSYKSPEFAQKLRVTTKTDVWCLGILILEILTGKIPTNYVLAQHAGYDSNLAGWINNIVREESMGVIDKQMKRTRNSEGQILKLLRIGATCCSEELSRRMELIDTVSEIEELNEWDE